MAPENVEEAMGRAGGPVPLLRNSPAAPHTFPVAPEHSNWRSEQHAWRETVALLDQSHHMTDLFLDGPEALRLLSELGVNSFRSFPVDKAKQFVGVNHDGYVIGDAILFHLAEDSFDLVGHPMIIDWVQYNLETGDYDATARRDGNSIVRPGPPELFRYELQGPDAGALVERLTGEALPDVRFFNMTTFRIAGLDVRALRHGMAGQPGFELFGPWEHGEQVLDAILVAGADLGLVRVGAKGYSTANLESGWVPAPLPAIWGEEMRAYREWLPAPSAGSLGGSFASGDIADYYLTPYELGYGRHVAFDHDFVGRAALERQAERPARTKVTLVWDDDDITRAFGTLFGPGDKAKYIDLPKARYALYQADTVLVGDTVVGMSLDCGYLANEEAFVSLASIDVAHAEVGTEVTVLWGEEPNTTKPQVEPHVQVPVRARVAPAPFVDFARTGYRADRDSRAV
ncbi:aminomethyltransferase family protein [Georgenia halophila]|uniref:Aminomethyltransferase family protein n=1 Tax=Georgenia halophila TaxID=620889 RepID=A0ABP8KTK1_9MICO